MPVIPSRLQQLWIQRDASSITQGVTPLKKNGGSYDGCHYWGSSRVTPLKLQFIRGINKGSHLRDRQDIFSLMLMHTTIMQLKSLNQFNHLLNLPYTVVTSSDSLLGGSPNVFYRNIWHPPWGHTTTHLLVLEICLLRHPSVRTLHRTWPK